MLTICLAILSLHFGRVLAGNIYRAMPAFVVSKGDLARILGRMKTKVSTRINDDGSLTETEDVIGDESQLRRFERVRFFAHLLLSA